MTGQRSDWMTWRGRYRQRDVHGAWKSHYGGGAFGPWGFGKFAKNCDLSWRESCALGARASVRGRDSRGEVKLVRSSSVQSGASPVGEVWQCWRSAGPNCVCTGSRLAELAGLAWRWCRWCIRRCRKAGHRWRDLCLPCDNVPALGRGAFAVSIESRRRLFGAAGIEARSVWCNPVQFRSVPSCPSSPPGRWRLVMSRGSRAGWLDWLGDGSKSSFRAEQSADPESMPHWKRLDSRLRGN